MLVIISFQFILSFSDDFQSSDGMKIICTEHDYQVDLENFKFISKVYAEKIQLKYPSP